jgi:DNA-damage-inducible protein J
MNTTMQIRIDASTKTKAQKAFKSMGIDMSSGVKMFLAQVAKDQCMPFVPSTAKTRAIRKKWDKEFDWVMKHGKGYSSTKEMFDAIESGK